jgi:nitronate monooxygenase
MRTALTRMLGIEHPIIQAPMAGGPTTPALAAAVSNAGGLGTLGAAYLAPDTLRREIAAVRALTDRPFGVNLFVPETPGVTVTAEQIARAQALLNPLRAELGLPSSPDLPPHTDSFADQLAVVIAERVPVLSFTFGIPAREHLDALRAAGILTVGTATTVAEGVALARAGVDAVVGQGSEAGGHRGTFVPDAAYAERALVGTLALIPQLVDVVRVPVIAAGGIGDGRGLLAALALGAAGAQMGTAFLACPESGAHPQHKAAVLAAADTDTVITRAFSGRSARGIVNHFIEALRVYEAEVAPFPAQNALTRDIRQAAARVDRGEYLSLWAGQAARLATARPASEVVRATVEQAERLLRQLGEMEEQGV